MENMCLVEKNENQMINLPPGFRFHPTDEELITHYLNKKVQDCRFCAIAIGEADLNKSEPWDLPRKAKIGEKEWYFFVLRDKKYPTGLRTNRATKAGYWKATGKDKEIYKGKYLVGMKKTLVFYTGRAPKGEKTNWVMHEFRLEGKLYIHNLPQSAKTEWVICRVIEKNLGGKKVHTSGITKMSIFDNDLGSSRLPALMDSSASNAKGGHVTTESLYAPCFSNPATNIQNNQENIINHFDNSIFSIFSNPYDNQPASNVYYSNNQIPKIPMKNEQNPGYLMTDDHEANGSSISREYFQTERDMISVSHETDLNFDTNIKISSVMSSFNMGTFSSAPSSLDIDGFWCC